MKTAVSECLAESTVTVPKALLLDLIGRAERASIGTLALYGLLKEKDLSDLGRVCWLNHLEDASLARDLGELAGVEVLTD